MAEQKEIIGVGSVETIRPGTKIIPAGIDSKIAPSVEEIEVRIGDRIIAPGNEGIGKREASE